MIESQGNGIWTVHQPLKIVGTEIGTRMTIIDYTGQGDLMVHSPVRPNDELVAEVKKLGTVKHIVAPNRWHHMFVKKFRAHFPEARTYCAPGLEKKRADINFDEILENGKTYPWSDSVQHTFVEGSPILNEVIFCHKGSRSLIVTDIGLHICEDSPLWTRIAFKAMGAFKKFGWSAPEKWLFIKDKNTFQNSMNEVLKWDFDQIMLCHGHIVKSNGYEEFKRAFS